MSVLINMEMPTSCDVCPLIAEADDYHVCYINEQFIPWEWIDEHSAEQRHPRPSWCPLVPVPPHGRLIDADAIPYNKIMLMDDDFYYGVTKPYIDRMPTIIEAEEGE